MEPKPSEATEAQQPQAEAKVAKEKKPRTDAQKAATAKALAAMTAKRGEMIKERKEKKEKVQIAKKAVEDKIIKEDVGFVFKNDFESLKKEVYELRGLLSASKKQDVSAPAPKQERIVERVIERVPSRSTTPTKLTGYELLDKVFFNK
jgi:hypothetical protein